MVTMPPQALTFPKTINPIPLSLPKFPLFSKPLKSLRLLPPTKTPKTLIPHCHPFSAFPLSSPQRGPPPPSAGRSKKTSGVRIEGGADLRREAKQNARKRSQKLAESFFYRLKNPHKKMADNFTEEELQMIGLGYDRMVQFMDKDDPNLKHPYDWYKYGEFGPYSWRGIVLGDPVRGRFSDENVTMYGEVKDHEEFDKIDMHDMSVDFGERMNSMNQEVGFRHFWVFVRHPRWRVTERPWEQWTLVAEVVVEAGASQRIDKWSLMARLGNLTRSLITKCAAWLRPDIIYVKRPVYQCRFEPQAEFFRALLPLLDPDTEKDVLFDVEDEEGRVERCTYFGGLCRIVKANPKAFVDDVVKAYEKLSDEKKSVCLGFLLTNHPLELLHPYTKEWKAMMEEMELGCDAPDDEDEGFKTSASGDKEFTEWAEEEGGDGYEDDTVIDAVDEEGGGGGDGDGIEEDTVIDVEGEAVEEVLGMEEEDVEPEESQEYWENEFKKAMSSNRGMEDYVRKSMERSNKVYANIEKHLNKTGDEEEGDGGNAEEDDFDDEAAMWGKRAEVKPDEEADRWKAEEEDFAEETARRSNRAEVKPDKEAGRWKAKEEDFGDETEMRGKRAKVKPEEWKRLGLGPWRKKIKKSRIPPELFLRAAVRPFTYKNLVKEIVLTRHAIIDGEIEQQ